MELSAGARVADRFEVEAPLGRGGMGVVYQVRDLQHGTLHALKVLPRVDDALRQRLLREGRLQGGLDHPGVVRVTDVIDVEGHPGLVLELVPGGRTLADRLAEGPVPRDETDRLADALFDAVGAAHAHGLVHRDLKPANILLDDGTPRIADFGLAKMLGDQGSVATATGALLGTPAYMAPEQVSDARTVDARADVFSLAAVLYELLSGRRAFPGAPTEAMWRAARGEAEALDLDDPRAAAVAWGLRPAPDDRPADVLALREAWNGGRVPSAALPSPCPDDLLDRPDDPELAAHLASCARCRVERRLFASFAEEPAPPQRPVALWGLGFVVGGLGALALSSAVVGGLSQLAITGPFLVVLLLLASLTGARHAHAATRARQGQSTSLLGWYLGPALILAVGATATALGAEQAIAAIERSQAAAKPAEHLAALAAAGSNVALSTWTIGYALGLAGVALPVVLLVVIARDEARDAGFDPVPVVIGVGGAAVLWLGEASAAGLVAFAAATGVALTVALLPRSPPTQTRVAVGLGAAVLVALTPVAARVEGLRRAVALESPAEAWTSVIDPWSLGWAGLAIAVGGMALRGATTSSLRPALGPRAWTQLVGLGLIAGMPTWWTVVRMRQLGALLGP